MKIQIKHTSRRGFTLVELLVVVVIIAILATLGFAVSLGAMQRARMVTSLSSATNVANAVEAFYSEYNLLPAPTAGAPDEDNDPAYKTDDTSGTDILEVLARLEADNDDMQNERKINFLSLKEAQNGNRDGIVYSSTGDAVSGLYDSWGQPFYIVIDYNYDGRLDFDIETTGYSKNVKLNNKHIAVYSLGTDSPTDAEPKHLVKTW
jgi:prepilin-type N-terminal cleavage/methylation domain-containing protein